MAELAPIKFEIPGEVERPRSRGRSAANTVVPIDRARPEWLKVRLPMGPQVEELRRLMRSKALHTVCEEAHCPNMAECWGAGTATFMILGDTCTRSCGFCAVKTGKPTELDLLEPTRVGGAVAPGAPAYQGACPDPRLQERDHGGSRRNEGGGPLDDARDRRTGDRRAHDRAVPPTVSRASPDRALLDPHGIRRPPRAGNDDG